MATNLKVLGQTTGSISNLVVLYQVPTNTQTVCSTITVCNSSSMATSFKIAIQPGSASIDPKHYIYYNTTIAGFDTFAATFGISLSGSDVVSVQNASASLNFSLFGQENT